MKRNAPPRHRTPVRRTSRKRASTVLLDKLARSVVLKRDQERCQKCGATERLQWCHIYTRRLHALRWNLDNSLILCAGDHLWWHHRPLDAARWFEEAFPERAKRLRLILQVGKGKLDHEALRLYLERQ